jgi:hypothetical protein
VLRFMVPVAVTRSGEPSAVYSSVPRTAMNRAFSAGVP